MTPLVCLAALSAAAALWLAVPGPRLRKGTTVRHGAPATADAARPLDPADLPLVMDLAASLLRAGQPVHGVLMTLARVVPGCRCLSAVAQGLLASMEWERAWTAAPDTFRPLAETLGFTHRSGAAAAALLGSAASEHRRSEARTQERRAAELGVRLVVPLGLCALPAFICVGILPLVISMLPEF